ncbi:MAG: sigma-54-dependent Fis family transcriptional regulator [Anaeromyxobacter sp.]|nr:sigma-54-dependent Fis family transcriptional regulator [Anaeromyxobacter sp.]MBL0278320.1 sigma-54-dependent Fis family transcriptional regulator [Anaeromyxobacter sp.]
MCRILVSDADEGELERLRALLAASRRFEVEVASDAPQAHRALAAGGFDLLLLDLDLPGQACMELLSQARQEHPDLEVVAFTSAATVEQAVETMRLGAADYLCKPVYGGRLIASLDRALERGRRRSGAGGGHARGGPHGVLFKEAFKDFVTQDRHLMQTLSEVQRIAQSANTVLIRGESGTGKELVAQAIHRLSSRSSHPFVSVSAAAFAAGLFDSQFFGHERGAFTGADSTARGLFEEAHGGTLFLDEIGDVEPQVQAKLLRALQSGEYHRVGSTRARAADVRVVAATNKDLEREIAAGRFRSDLYYRLDVSVVELPPLRQRPGDVELLAHYFLDRHGGSSHLTSIAADALLALDTYRFPGNVRELENAIASAVVLETSDTLGLHALPAPLRAAAPRAGGASPPGVRRTLADMESEHILAVVDYTSGNRSAAARILGISRMGLLSKLKRLGGEHDPAAAAGVAHPRPLPAGHR